MEIIQKSLDELKPYEKNPRKNDGAVDYVAESIKEFGFKVPLVIDKDGIIVTGHTRYRAAKKLGLDKVPCIIADDLTEDQLKAYRLADNKVSEFSKWDNNLINFEIADIELDMSIFGFDFNIDEPEDEPEIEFTESLEEEHNYIVLYFDNNIDWLQAQSLFNIKKVKEYSTRKDGAVKKPRTGIGRVLNGAKALSTLTEGCFNEN